MLPCPRRRPHVMDVGQRVLWLLLALLTLALAHERTQARDQCFRLIAPTPEDDGTPYELDEDEYSELGLLFNINCEALPFAESMRVRSDGAVQGSIVTFEEWQTEHYEMTVATSRRGVIRWSFELVRIGRPAVVERVQVDLGVRRLFGPRVVFGFPPPDFAFHKGVGPFWKIDLEEDENYLARHRLGPFISYALHERVHNLDTGESRERRYDNINLAYLDSDLPDGTYNLTLTPVDLLGRSYPPGTSLTFHQDRSRAYQPRSTNIDLTACPAMAQGESDDEAGDGCRCEHGVCIAGACLCEADWFGQYCNVDVHDADVYLPPQDPAGSVWACHQAGNFRKGVQDLQDMILSTQFPVDPRNCESDAQESGGLQAFHPDSTSAFGVNLRSLALALGRALRLGRPLTVAGGWPCLLNEDCADGEFTCYFQPLTSCLRDSQTPSCGWVDNGQELDWPRRTVHPLCRAWEAWDDTTRVGEQDSSAREGGGGGGVCVAHSAQAQHVRNRGGSGRRRAGRGGDYGGGMGGQVVEDGVCEGGPSGDRVDEAHRRSEPSKSRAIMSSGGGQKARLTWGEEAGEGAMWLVKPDVLIDTVAAMGENVIVVGAGRWGVETRWALTRGARWLTHPMGAHPVLDLTKGHLEQITSERGGRGSDGKGQRGEATALGQGAEVTMFVWVEWRAANVPARVAWRGPGQVAIAVQSNSRELGLFVEDHVAADKEGDASEGVKFVGCGYNISVAGWQLVLVVRRSSVLQHSSTRAVLRVDSTFYVNGERVCVAQHHMRAPPAIAVPDAEHGSRKPSDNGVEEGFGFRQLGQGKLGPGFVGMAGLWAQALSDREVWALWVLTGARFGYSDLLGQHSASDGGEAAKRDLMRGARRWTLAMSAAPERFKDKGSLWFMAHMLQYVMRPNLQLERLVLAAKRAVGWVTPSLGVHVRRGDACDQGHERLCMGAGDLLEDIRHVYHKYALRGVYLATDSASIVQQLQSAAPEMKWMVLEPLDRTQLDTRASAFGSLPRMLQMRMGLYDTRSLAESAFTDLLLLAQADALAGQFSSHFFKTAFALAVADKGFLPPYIGWDGPPSW